MHGAEQDAERQPERQPDRVDVRQPALGVAEERRDLPHPCGGRDHPQPVAGQQHELVGRHHVDVAPTHPGDGRTEPVEVELADRPAGERLAGQRDPAEVQVAAVGGQRVRRPVPQVAGHRVDDVARPDDGDQVALAQRLLVLGDQHRARLAVPHPGEHDVPATGRDDVRDGRGVGALDPDREVRQPVRAPAVRPSPQHRRGRDEHADDAEQVGDRVADGRRGRVPRPLARRRQRRGVRQRAGERAGDRGAGDAERPAEQGGDRRDAGERGGDGDDRPPAAAQRGEERRAADDADRVGEQHEPERPDDLGDGELHAVRGGHCGDGDRGEQHRGRADGDVLDPDAAERRADAEQPEQEGERLLAEEDQHLVHGGPTSLCRARSARSWFQHRRPLETLSAAKVPAGAIGGVTPVTPSRAGPAAAAAARSARANRRRWRPRARP